MTNFDSTCIPCIMEQSLKTVDIFLPDDEELKKNVLTEMCKKVVSSKPGTSAPHLSAIVQEMIARRTGIEDLYLAAKEQNLKKALSYDKDLKDYYESSVKKFESAVKIAIAGNIIDLGANPDFNIRDEIEKLADDDIDNDALLNFQNAVREAKTILYIADNLEEAVFDKYLLKELGPRNIVFAVRSKPVLNDITLEPAIELGIGRFANVIESGSNIPGTDLEMCTEEFKSIFYSADLVISKGQGNFETLVKQKREIYFLFKVKCKTIAQKCGYDIMKSVIYKNTINPKQLQEIK